MLDTGELSPVYHEHQIVYLTVGHSSLFQFKKVVQNALAFFGLAMCDCSTLETYKEPLDGSACFIELGDLDAQQVSQLCAFVDRACGHSCTVLLSGFSGARKGHRQILAKLSPEGSVNICSTERRSEIYWVHPKSQAIAGMLAGARIPWKRGKSEPGFYYFSRRESDTIIGIGNEEDAAFPYMIRLQRNQGSIFLLAEMPLTEPDTATPSWVSPPVLCALILIRSIEGKLCWHNSTPTANLTIDDPFLIEPYGHLRFHTLLSEMMETHFHTTIGFIPRNARRNCPAIVSMFAHNQDHFSLAVHGNDHDGYEFSHRHSLQRQREKIAQALARMNYLKNQSGLDYSRVMIFPHAIGTTAAIDLLNEFGFDGSVNRQVLPMDGSKPKAFSFGLRPAQVNTGGLPLCERWWPESIVPELEAFLGKPLLIYTHHQFFLNGMPLLRKTVASINRLSPLWCDLGTVMTRLFLEKTDKSNNIHIWMFSRSIDYFNDSACPRRVTFYRYEDNPSACFLLCNGIPRQSSLKEDLLSLSVDLDPFSRVRVSVQHPTISMVTKLWDFSPRISTRRRLSEFRDRYLDVWKTKRIGRTRALLG